jgi:hypothetical protein
MAIILKENRVTVIALANKEVAFTRPSQREKEEQILTSKAGSEGRKSPEKAI